MLQRFACTAKRVNGEHRQALPPAVAVQSAAEAAAALPGTAVVVVGLFLDDGPHGDADVRVALRVIDRPVVYSGAIGADAGLVPLILAQAAVQ